jgi:hypothetical protein
MSVRSIALAALIACASPVFAQPPATATPRGRGATPAPSQAPRGDAPRAQVPRTAGATPAEAPVAPRARREGQPLNIRVEVTVTDQRGAAAPLKKTISVVVAEGMGGRIRSTAEFSQGWVLPLNVDAEPQLLPDGKIRLMVNLQYDLPSGSTGSEAASSGVGTLRRTQLQENLPLVLENGKSMVVSQSADPISDRQVTVEVKATVLR